MISSKKENKGFSLFEVLVAIALAALFVLTLTGGIFTYSPRDRMDDAMAKVEKAIRFSISEAALRNTLTRVTFELSEENQSFVVEFGPDNNYVLPRQIKKTGDTDGLREAEDQKKLIEKVSKEFNRIPDFTEEDGLMEEVQIYGIGSNLYPKLINEGPVSIYTYSSGEKDSTLIFFYNENELGVLSTTAFLDEYTQDYYPFDDELVTDDEKQEWMEKTSKEIFEKWKRK